MSYNPMMGSSHNRNSYMPEYESSSYKIPNQSFSHGQFSTTTQSLYNQSSNSTSIALFHIPPDGTNSLYVDGVPNDTSEREVSRNCLFSQIFFDHSQGFSAFAWLKRQPPQEDSFSYVLLISRMFCSPQ